jgi:hypothetical protein
MDTDGSFSAKHPGVAKLSTTSRQLANDVAFIAQTLGGVATIYKIPSPGSLMFPQGKECQCRDSYAVDVKLPDGLVPFKLSRKANDYQPSNKYKVRRSITAIELVGVKDCQCIEVEDALYLTDHCIVTHNSMDPRKNEDWVASKKPTMAPNIWAAEYEIDYTAAVEDICIPASWVESAKKIAKLAAAAGKILDPLVDGIGGGDIGAGKAKSVFVARFGPIVTVPVGWGDPDTIDTAHKMLDQCRDTRLKRSTGHDCTVKYFRFDSPGVGFGIQSVLKRNQRVGLTVSGVNTGHAPTNKRWPDSETSEEKFGNLKAEAWWTARERFKITHEMVQFLEGKEGGIEHPLSDCISIPDDTQGPHAQQLAQQLSMVKWSRNERGKIVMETKISLAARGIVSPDYADALILTFAGESVMEKWEKFGKAF